MTAARVKTMSVAAPFNNNWATQTQRLPKALKWLICRRAARRLLPVMVAK